MYVIIYGDLSEGLQGIIGPFESEDAAENYADTFNLRHYPKSVRPLDKPIKMPTLCGD